MSKTMKLRMSEGMAANLQIAVLAFYVLSSVLLGTGCASSRMQPDSASFDADRNPANSESLSVGQFLLDPIDEYGASFKLAQIQNVQNELVLTDKTGVGSFRRPSTYRAYRPAQQVHFKTFWQRSTGAPGQTYFVGQDVLVKTYTASNEYRKARIYDLTEDGLVRIDASPDGLYFSLEDVKPLR